MTTGNVAAALIGDQLSIVLRGEPVAWERLIFRDFCESDVVGKRLSMSQCEPVSTDR